MRISEQDYLIHYGVKGMRWGIRKERERSGRTRTNKRQKNRPKRQYRTISQVRKEEGKRNAAVNRAFNDTDRYSVEVIKPMLNKKYGDIKALSSSQKSAYEAEKKKLIREYYNRRYSELMRTG